VNFLDLFSGIGGFRLGAEWAGVKFEHEFHSDIEPFANKVYAKHFPQSIQLGDVQQIDGTKLKEQYGKEWIITGGFPCQDISVAGKGFGISGERSSLWFEMQRILGELRPRYAIMENVPALTFRGLDRVLGSLADIRYDAEWTTVSARDVGASHLRKRIWIIAYTQEQQSEMRDSEPSKPEQMQFGRINCKNEFSDTNQKRQEWNHESKNRQQLSERRNARSELATFDSQDELSNTDKIRFGRRSSQERRSRESSFNGSKDWSISEMVQAYNGHLQWQRTFEPEFVRVVDGIPNQLDRIGACGNSIVPQIAEIIFRLIKGE